MHIHWRGGNPQPSAQLMTKFITTWWQYKACFVCWGTKMKEKQNKKEEMSTWKGQCCRCVPCDMSHNTQKKLACGLPCDSCFHPYFPYFFFLKSLSQSSLVRPYLFWLSLLKVETWSCRKASCVYIQPLLLVKYLRSFCLLGDFHSSVHFTLVLTLFLS